MNTIGKFEASLIHHGVHGHGKKHHKGCKTHRHGQDVGSPLPTPNPNSNPTSAGGAAGKSAADGTVDDIAAKINDSSIPWDQKIFILLCAIAKYYRTKMTGDMNKLNDAQRGNSNPDGADIQTLEEQLKQDNDNMRSNLDMMDSMLSRLNESVDKIAKEIGQG